MATRNFVPRGDGEGSIGTTVKNWAGGFFKKLAVGAITTAVTVLTPAADANNQQPATTGWVRAQFQSILTTVLSAAGLKYNIARNGYICFGALFGGLILQWRPTPGISTEKRIHAYPIAFSTTVLYAHAVWYAGVEYEFRPTLDIVTNKTTKFSFQGADHNDRSYFLFAIGY